MHHAIRTTTTLAKPVVLTVLAGTLLSSTGCERRWGYWNRNTQQQVEQQKARQVAANTTTNQSAYFTPNTPEHTTGAPRSSGSSVQDLAVRAELASATPNNADPSTNTSGISSPKPLSASTSTPSNRVTSASISTSPSPESLVSSKPVTSAAPEPYSGAPTPAPNSVEGGDLSAWVYSNAMGIELPSEQSSEFYRATVNVRKITSAYAGSDFDPIVSPDGNTIYFASTQHRPTADIYAKSVKGAVVTRLTDDPAQDVMPTANPDGSSIAFASDRAGSWDIYMMPSEGGKTVQLTRDTSHDLHPTFSPDGTKVAFCRLGQQSGRWELWVQDVASDHGAQFIGFGLFPEWCPTPGTGTDGSDLILFQRSRERGDRAFSVWTVEFNPGQGSAGRETEIAAGAGQALINPTWSPDGRFVCFAAVPYSQSWSSAQSDRPDSSTIWMVSVDGTNKVKLTDGSSVDLMPAWGRNNDIFFVSNMDGQDHLWSMELSQAVRAASLRNPEFESSFATAPTDQE